jgi:hypothetical protein
MAQSSDFGRLAYGPQPAELREAVAKANQEAAADANETVSESCNEESVPVMVLRGTNVSTYIPDVIQQAGTTGVSRRLVGATWAANGKGHARTR